jgi:glycosyltransferase involved in cell wall biosynthesis
MKISIAMCTYNGERYIQEQLDSFVDQSRKPDELVVCDDCSTDATLEILRAFAARVPFPVRIVENETNLGSTRNFAKAIALCSGDLIALSDQDDVWRSRKLALQAEILDGDRTIGGVFSDGELIGEQSEPTGQSLWSSMGYTSAMQAHVEQDRTFEVLKKQYFVTGATLMFRSEMRRHFQEIPLIWIHDAWITWKLAIHSRLVGVASPLVGYRVHANNQVGVGTQDVGELLKKRTLAQMAGILEKELQQLAELRAEISSSDAGRSREACQTIERRMRFLQRRAERIARPAVTRPLYILAAWPQYQEFAKGWRSALGDSAL